MRAEICKAADVIEFFTTERCYITEVANDSGDETASVARARVKPGVTTTWHKLMEVQERYLVISGSGLVELENLDPVSIVSGDVVRIPASTAQRITNTGTEDLVFFAVCTPRFTPECYVSLGE